ncbi:hypothetical protein CSUI_000207 [Cystoisospora suis]|uniref:Uncharacterized protein n=1 Tax=Cystoisospora suis TaxID=483139 RepID=A0A2C6LEX0_9APIC|nr:hypothetical protein CSUI_000207 [Cystoisospora suis]
MCTESTVGTVTTTETGAGTGPGEFLGGEEGENFPTVGEVTCRGDEEEDDREASTGARSGGDADGQGGDGTAKKKNQVKLERWLHIDRPAGFIPCGASTLLHLTLNVQEAVLEPQDLVYTVLVIRLEDSKQDVFFSVSTSVLPSLLGAAPSQLQKISNRSIIMAPAGGRVLGGERGEEEDVNGFDTKECSATTTTTTEEEGMKTGQQIERVHEDKRVSRRAFEDDGKKQKEEEQRKNTSESSYSVERSVGASVGSAEREEEERNVSSPLPKEIWWLLVHIYSQISSQKKRKRTFPRRNKVTVHDPTTGGPSSKKSSRTGCHPPSSSASDDSTSAKGEQKVNNEEPHSPPSGDPGRGDISSSSSLSMRRRSSIALEGEKDFDLASFLSSPCSAVLQRPKHLRGSTTFFRREGEGDHGGGRGEKQEESTMSSDLELNTKISSDPTERRQRDSSFLRETVETSNSGVNPAEGDGFSRRKEKEEEKTKTTVVSAEGAGTQLGGADGSMVMSSERAEEGQQLTRRRKRLADQKFQSTEEDEEAARRKREVSLEEEAEFVRMCVESGVVVPNNVSVDAALMVLAKWGNSVVIVPSEFTVREVGDDDLHMLCRAMLLSLPTSQRNIFLSVVSLLRLLLEAAISSFPPLCVCHASGGTGCDGEEIDLEDDEARKELKSLLLHATIAWLGRWLMPQTPPQVTGLVLEHFLRT